MGIEKPFWKSKKWILAVIGILIPPLNLLLGWELSLEMVAPIVAYVVGQGIADYGKNQ